jgi:hypothetical protein
MKSVSVFLGRRPQSPTPRQPGNKHRRNVSKIVNRVAEQRNRMPEITSNKLSEHQKQSSSNRSAQKRSHPRRRKPMRVRMGVSVMVMHSIMRMHMHKPIVTTDALSCLCLQRRAFPRNAGSLPAFLCGDETAVGHKHNSGSAEPFPGVIATTKVSETNSPSRRSFLIRSVKPQPHKSAGRLPALRARSRARRSAVNHPHSPRKCD